MGLGARTESRAPFLLMKDIKDLQSGVYAIMHGFGKEFGRMDFLFIYSIRSRNTKTLINVVRSVPGLLMQITDHNAPDIDFESSWVPEKNNREAAGVVQGGWNGAASNLWGKRSYLAHIFACIRRVRELSIYPYGFEIKSADNIDVMGVLSSCLSNPSTGYLQSIVGTTFESLPLNPAADTELTARWTHPKWEQIIEFQGSNPDFPRMGQTNRKLLVEDEGV